MTSRAENSAHDLLHNAHFVHFKRKRRWRWTYGAFLFSRSPAEESRERFGRFLIELRASYASSCSFAASHFHTNVAIVSHTFLSRSDCRMTMTMKIHQFAFHDQFVFSGPLVEIEKSRGLATARRKTISLFYFILYFFFAAAQCGEKEQIIRNGLRLRKK